MASVPERSRRFCTPGSHIVHELIDDEVIVIDFVTGSYYSLSGSAVDAWNALAAGSTVDETTAQLCLRYDAEPSEVRAAILGFAHQLEHEGVLVARDDGGEPVSTPTSAVGERIAFVPPLLEKFTDLEDLIVLDPVHDVSDTGWPHARPAAR